MELNTTAGDEPLLFPIDHYDDLVLPPDEAELVARGPVSAEEEAEADRMAAAILGGLARDTRDEPMAKRPKLSDITESAVVQTELDEFGLAPMDVSTLTEEEEEEQEPALDLDDIYKNHDFTEPMIGMIRSRRGSYQGIHAHYLVAFIEQFFADYFNSPLADLIEAVRTRGGHDMSEEEYVARYNSIVHLIRDKIEFVDKYARHPKSFFFSMLKYKTECESTMYPVLRATHYLSVDENEITVYEFISCLRQMSRKAYVYAHCLFTVTDGSLSDERDLMTLTCDVLKKCENYVVFASDFTEQVAKNYRVIFEVAVLSRKKSVNPQFIVPEFLLPFYMYYLEQGMMNVNYKMGHECHDPSQISSVVKFLQAMIRDSIKEAAANVSGLQQSELDGICSNRDVDPKEATTIDSDLRKKAELYARLYSIVKFAESAQCTRFEEAFKPRKIHVCNDDPRISLEYTRFTIEGKSIAERLAESGTLSFRLNAICFATMLRFCIEKVIPFRGLTPSASRSIQVFMHHVAFWNLSKGHLSFMQFGMTLFNGRARDVFFSMFMNVIRQLYAMDGTVDEGTVKELFYFHENSNLEVEEDD